MATAFYFCPGCGRECYVGRRCGVCRNVQRENDWTEDAEIHEYAIETDMGARTDANPDEKELDW